MSRRLLLICAAPLACAMGEWERDAQSFPTAPSLDRGGVRAASASAARTLAVSGPAACATADTVTYTAVAKDTKGVVVTSPQLSWASGNSAVAPIVSVTTTHTTARVLCAAAGQSTITVSWSVSNPPPPVAKSLTVTGSPLPPPPSGPLPVVPGLVGFGTTTPAGRGGAVIRVTNLNDSGVGSLRAALLTTGPRTVVFDVSGVITLNSRITMADANSFLTVAGQTAPSPGVTIRNFGIASRAHDILIQHLRCRNGDASGVTDNDCFEEWQGYNVVLDHVSMSWAKDENVSTWPFNGPVRDMTVANAILTENMGSGSLLFGDGNTNNLVIGSLMTNNPDRDPYVKGGAGAAVVNNLIYNWCGNTPTATADPEGSGPSLMAVVGNVYKRGPSSPGVSTRPIWVFGSTKPGSQVYVADNRDSGVNGGSPPSDPWLLVQNQVGASVVATSPPVWPAGLTAAPSAGVQASVLANAGAWPAARDAVDARVWSQASGGSGGACITSQGQAGGYPTIASSSRVFPVPATPNGDDDGDGYTNLEELLHEYARTAEGR